MQGQSTSRCSPRRTFSGLIRSCSSMARRRPRPTGWERMGAKAGPVFRRAGLRRLHDRPADAGRSAWHPGDGATRMFTAQEEFQFTANAVREPGRRRRSIPSGQATANKGQKGDPIFDAFYATQVETVISKRSNQQRNQDAGAALLDKIGPAIVLTHSQSGIRLVDRRCAAATSSRPLSPSSRPAHPSRPQSSVPARRAYGARPTSRSRTIPGQGTRELAVGREAQADGPDLFVCWMQKRRPDNCLT